MASKFFLIFFIILSQVFAYSYFLNRYLNYVFLKRDIANDQKVQFEIQKGENINQISNRLLSLNIIESPYFFKLYLKKNGIERSIKAGNYILSYNMSISEIADTFVFAKSFFYKKVTIPEGSTLKDIVQILSSKEADNPGLILNLKVKDFNGEFSFLQEINPKYSLEGFLFPDTYFFTKEELANPKFIVKTMLKNFETKIINSNILNEIKKSKFSLFEVIILASILEKEVKTENDMKMVSDLLQRRLKIGMPLQVDASIIYTLTGKKILTREDLRKDSDYNTYTKKGLPKGPISNPGIKSINAVLHPIENEYWYYLSAKDGKTVFSKTYQEHIKAINKYLR